MKTNTTIGGLFLLLTFMTSGCLEAQNYRTAEAYLSDFGKNERYITESLIAYSSSLVNDKESRSQATLKTIYNKLDNINTIVAKNNVGFGGDTSLRDTYLKMNNAMLMLLDDNTLKLDNYEAQRHLSYEEILRNFELKRSNVINYYSLMVDYTNAKRNFSKVNHVKHDRYFSNRNIFEYHSHQSLIFYKLNVLDAKLADLLMTNDEANVRKGVDYLNQVSRESLVQIDEYTNQHIDQSLNNASRELITFLSQRNEQILPLYKDYIEAKSNFSNTEKAAIDSNSPEKLNALEKELTVAKTKFENELTSFQNKKKSLVDNWMQAERNLLKTSL